MLTGVGPCLGPSFRFPLFGGRGVGGGGVSRSGVEGGRGGAIHLSMANEERRKRPGTYAEKKKEKKERGGVQEAFLFRDLLFFLGTCLLQCRPPHVFMHVGEGRKPFFFDSVGQEVLFLLRLLCSVCCCSGGGRKSCFYF
jgi:hypothetical protein